MRVGFIYRDNPRQLTANCLSMFKNIAAVKRLGHEVALLVPREWLAAGAGPVSTEDALRHLGVAERFPVVGVPRPTARGRGRRTFDVMSALYARLKSFDLVWSREIHSADYTSLAGLPTVLEHHHPFRPNQLSAVRRMMKRRAFRGVLAISEAHKRLLVGDGLPEEKILAAHSGVDLDSFRASDDSSSDLHARWSLSTDAPVVLYAGSLYHGRGGDQILEASRSLSKAQFILIGGRDFEIAQLKERFGVNGHGNVRFTGSLPHAELPAHLLSADVLVAPYTAECQDIGGKVTIPYASPIKLFEYMAAGKPIVTSNIGAIPEVVRHEENGLLVEPGSVEELVGAIKRLLDDRALAERLGAAARRDARLYTWDERAARVLDFASARRRINPC